MLEAQRAMTSQQLWIWGEAGGGGGEAPGSSRDPTAHISQKMPKIHSRGPFTLNYNFVNFVH